MFVEQFLLVAASLALGVLVLASIYMKTAIGVCRSKRDLKGKTVIVTGANTGIGFETAKDLAARNARVILACRTVSTAKKALRDIAVITGNNNLVVKQVDISSFDSVREFAEDILKSERSLDILVNNAAVMYPLSHDKTVDGLEVIMATNHFGPFLLTNLLLPLLKKSAPSRIVVVSSLGHEKSQMDFDNLNGEQFSDDFSIYKMSKLANVFFTTELARRLKGTGVTVNALHPGIIHTDIIRNLNWFLRSASSILSPFFAKTLKEGAQTSIYVAVSEELEGVSGKYFSDCAEKPLNEHAKDSNTANKLWLCSQKITGFNKKD